MGCSAQLLLLQCRNTEAGAGVKGVKLDYSAKENTLKVMIRSSRDAALERFFDTGRSPRKAGWSAQSAIAGRKLDMLDAAERLNDLHIPPGNRLEALSGDRAGQHSIRINSQWRICFAWKNGGAEEVEIVDYH